MHVSEAVNVICQARDLMKRHYREIEASAEERYEDLEHRAVRLLRRKYGDGPVPTYPSRRNAGQPVPEEAVEVIRQLSDWVKSTSHFFAEDLEEDMMLSSRLAPVTMHYPERHA